MAGLASEASFGSSIFGGNLGKGDVFIHQVKRTAETQIAVESSRCTIGLFWSFL
jgi:hypothetical protein